MSAHSAAEHLQHCRLPPGQLACPAGPILAWPLLLAGQEPQGQAGTDQGVPGEAEGCAGLSEHLNLPGRFLRGIDMLLQSVSLDT